MKPTLYIGMGGFGSEIVRLLKENLDKGDTRETHTCQFLALDTKALDVNDKLQDTEYVECIGINIKETIEYEGEQLKWFKELVNELPEHERIKDGADANRLIGRLALRARTNVSKFINKLSSACSELFQFDTSQTIDAVKIYFISSITGGTGSGCLLDVMGITRAVIDQTISQGVEIEMNAIILPADIVELRLSPTSRAKIFANTYATLKELHYFWAGNKIKELICSKEHPCTGITEMELSRRALPTVIYYVSRMNEEGKAICDDDTQIMNMIVNFLLAELKPEVEEKFIGGRMPNPYSKENTKEMTDLHGHYNLLSSFSVFKFTIPYKELKGCLYDMLMRHCIERELKPSLGMEATEKDVSSWFRDSHLSEIDSDELQESLRRDIKWNISMDAPSNGLNLDNIISKHLKKIDDNARNFEKDIKKRLKDKVHKCIQSYSLRTAYDFMAVLMELIERHKEALNKEIADTEKRVKFRLKTVDNAIEDIKEAKEGWSIFFWKKEERIYEAEQNFQNVLKKCGKEKIKLHSQQKALSVYENLIDNIKKDIREIEAILQYFNGALKNISRRERARYGHFKKRLEVDASSNLTNEICLINLKRFEEIKKGWKDAFSKNADIVDSLREKLLHFVATNKMQGEDKDIIARLWEEIFAGQDAGQRSPIRDFIEQEIRQLSIPEYINSLRDDQTQMTALKYIVKELISPRYPLRMEVGPYPTTIMVLKRDDTPATDIYRLMGLDPNDITELKLTHNGDDFSWQFIVIRHGYSIESGLYLKKYYASFCSQMELYEEKHSMFPPHVFPDVLKHGEELIKETSDFERLFSIGLAFGYIERSGNSYSIVLSDGTKMPLESGLDKAINVFVSDMASKEAVRKQRDEFINRNGLSNYRDKLEEAVERFKKEDKRGHFDKIVSYINEEIKWVKKKLS